MAVDIVRVAARQMPIISTAAKGAQEDKYNFMDSELVMTVVIVESGTLRGNFKVDSQTTIFELKNSLLGLLPSLEWTTCLVRYKDLYTTPAVCLHTCRSNPNSYS